MFASLQTEFAGAVLDAARPVPHGVTSLAGGAVKRFAVYRNNVMVGLIEALRTRFPVVEAILGEECFIAIARAFIERHPPRSPLMMFYGDTLADFLAGFAPLAALDYLADVARLEAARTHAYHAADAAPLDPALVEGLDMRLAPHPAARVVRSHHPIVTIWGMNSGEIPLGPIDDLPAEDALVTRPRLVVTVQRLPPGTADLLQALTEGQPLGAALETAMARKPDFDPTAGIAALIGAGAVRTVPSSDRSSP